MERNSVKVLYITNIPVPYTIDFLKCFAQKVELTVVFEARRVKGISFNWNDDTIENFNAIFLSDGEIQEKKTNRRILKFISKNKYDCVIFGNYAYYTEAIALLKAKWLQIPYILAIDGGIIKNDKWIKYRIKKFFIAGARCYLSPSLGSDLYLVNYGADVNDIYRYPFTSLKNEDILTNVVSYEKKNKLKRYLNINHEKVILAVGQFIHRKGFDILLESCRYIEENWGVYIVGGEPPDEYINIVHKHNLNNVHFINYQTKEELENYYKLSDIFVLPTRFDIWALVINEAMSYGLPIITTDKCSAGLELIENNINGYIVPVENIIELSDKINLILRNEPVAKAMAENNLKKIRQYTVEKMTEAYFDVCSKF